MLNILASFDIIPVPENDNYETQIVHVVDGPTCKKGYMFRIYHHSQIRQTGNVETTNAKQFRLLQ